MSSVAPVMKDEKFYKPLESYLIVVNNECIALEGPDTKRSVEVTKKVLDELIVKMKEANTMFAWMFNRLTYVGSYFEGLRVKEATEFDINVVLKLPLLYEKIEVSRDPEYPGFVKVNVKNAKYPEDKLKWRERETEEVFKWWANADGDLSHLKVLRWWESIFSKLNGLSTLTVDGRVYKITKFVKAGPAMTAHISDDNDYGIDVDLVPVIEFPENLRPPQPIRQAAGAWYIVPKRIDTNEYVWRLSFSPQEKALMNGKNTLKMVTRFLKRIRDVLNLKPVSSYYIKTIFLWEASLQSDSTFFNKNLGFMLLYFLGKWNYYLEQKKLPFFWDQDMNLFEKINAATLDNYAARIKKLKEQMEKIIQKNNTKELNELLKKLFNPNGDIIVKPRSESTRCKKEESNLSASPLIDLGSSNEEQNCNDLVALLAPWEPMPEPKPVSESNTDQFNLSLDFVKSSLNPLTTSVDQVTSPANQMTSTLDQATPSSYQVTPSAYQVTSSPADGGYSSTSPKAAPDSTSPEPDSCPLPQSNLETAKEKTLLEVEECKLRLRIAELDLETAKYNLKTAERRFELISLQFNALKKVTTETEKESGNDESK